jgi:hypothetical protein
MAGQHKHQLHGNEHLHINESLWSPDDRFELKFQPEGVLELRYYLTNGRRVVRLGGGRTSPHRDPLLAMQTDGNLCLYTEGWSGSDRPRNAVWVKSGGAGAYLELQNDGNLVLYRPNRTDAWASGAVGDQHNHVIPSRPLAEVVGGSGVTLNLPGPDSVRNDLPAPSLVRTGGSLVTLSPGQAVPVSHAGQLTIVTAQYDYDGNGRAQRRELSPRGNSADAGGTVFVIGSDGSLGLIRV